MRTETRLIDITPPVRSGMAVFPGDAVYQSKPSFQIGPECPVNVAEFSVSYHCGAHADAPLHYDPHGATIDELDLDDFVGLARLIDARGEGPLCCPEDIKDQLPNSPPRILFRLAKRQDPMVWPTGFRSLAPSTLELLVERGVRLVGVDVPSVHPDTFRGLPAHMVARCNNMRILENLELSGVSSGDYELIALPMKLEDLDAAPVRAVLRFL